MGNPVLLPPPRLSLPLPPLQFQMPMSQQQFQYQMLMARQQIMLNQRQLAEVQQMMAATAPSNKEIGELPQPQRPSKEAQVEVHR